MISANKIYQTDKEFEDEASAHAWCCYLSCIWHLADKWRPDIWTHESIDHAYKTFVGEGNVDSDGTVENAQALADEIVGVGKVKYLGHADVGTPIPDDCYALGVFQREFAPDETPFVHFVVINRSGNVVYDPWSADGSRSVREGKMISMRLFKILDPAILAIRDQYT